MVDGHEGVEGLPVLLIPEVTLTRVMRAAGLPLLPLPGVAHGHVEAGQAHPQLHVLSTRGSLATLSLMALKGMDNNLTILFSNP